MAVPVFAGAGSGAAVLTGTGTVSKTGCIAGNLLLIQFFVRGTTEDWSAFSNVVNIEGIDGTDNATTGVVAAQYGVFIGRVMANGTCSGDATVGASGEDIFMRMYEFSGASAGASVASVLENGVGITDTSSAISTDVGDAPLTTNGGDRLGLNFVYLNNNQAIGSFTGETGGDWTEAVAEYQEATGATATLQLQTTAMPSAGSIDGGAVTIGTSIEWVSRSTAIIPASGAPPTLLVTRSGLRW